MTKDRLENEYFEWMYRKVQWWDNDISYRKLLQFLHTQKFYYLIPCDDNRYMDGINLRYLFGELVGYDHRVIAELLDDRECSVLEMMVALSNRCETEIMTLPNGEDRTGYWFWCMLVSLDLYKMTDMYFNKDRANDILTTFLERKYAPNGKGGLFTIKHPNRDLTQIEIWYQLMWFLNELDEENDNA